MHDGKYNMANAHHHGPTNTGVVHGTHSLLPVAYACPPPYATTQAITHTPMSTGPATPPSMALGKRNSRRHASPSAVSVCFLAK